MTEELTLVIGTYTHSLPHVVARGKGIEVLRWNSNTHAFTPISTFTGLRNPTYVAPGRPGLLYAVEELFEQDGASAVALAFDDQTADIREIGRAAAEGDWPCHISLDKAGRRLFVSNYLSGSFLTYELDETGAPTGETLKIQRDGTGPNAAQQEGPHVHQGVISPDGSAVLICDAGTDEIACHLLTERLIDPQPETVIKTTGGYLPRHLVFSADGKTIYVLHELGCAVRAYSYGTGEPAFLMEASTLPVDFSGESACAAIRLHPNGRFLYASNRGHDSIVAMELGADGASMKPIGWYSTRGQTPRDFAIDPTGRFLVAANQDSHSICIFRIDADSGVLTPVGDIHEIGSPVCVVFA